MKLKINLCWGLCSLIPFEICEWSYNHKVGANSHIWFDKGQYSVPSDFLNKYVDVRYNGTMVYIYSSHKLIAEHKRLPSGIKNGKRTEASHLPYPPYTPETIGSTTAKAEKIKQTPGIQKSMNMESYGVQIITGRMV